MHKKLLSILTTFALVAGLLSFAAPAFATHEDVDGVASLMPNDGFTDKDQLSDAPDGTDSLAHLTAIADPAADRVLWYVCVEADSAPGTDNDQCDFIGQDTSGTQPEAGTSEDPDETDQAAEAYEFFWDIPAAYDSDASGDEYDIHAIACNGEPDDLTNLFDATNCAESDGGDREDSIHLDDSATSSNTGAFADHTAIPTGEIRLVCTGGEGGTESEECDEVEEATAFEHGGTLPAGDFAVGFTTSDDVDAASACIDDLGDNDQLEERDSSAVEPEGCDYYANTVVLLDETNDLDPDPGQAWIAFFSDARVVDGGDFEVAIFGTGDDDVSECNTTGDGFAGTDDNNTFIVDEDGNVIVADAGDGGGNDGVNEASGVCVFDEHYAASTELENSSLEASFDIDADDGCNEDEEINDEHTNLVTDEPTEEDADTEEVEGCTFDQFGELSTDLDTGAGERVVFELTGDAGTFSDTGDCDAQDLDDDDAGQFEVAVCDTAGSSGEGDEYDVLLDPLYDDDGNVVRGTSTVAFCIDGEGDDTDDANFGCADDDVSGDVTKHYAGQAVDVALAFQGTGTTEDPCAGDQFKTNVEGDSDTLIVCTYDAQGNLVSTGVTDFSGDTDESGRISWANSNASAVAFTSNPPNDTGADGTNTLGIQAVDQGSSTVTVTLAYDSDLDDDVDDDDTTDSSSVTKTVQEQTGGGVECNDGVDNDGDGDVDYPADDGCASIDDDTENSDGVDPTTTFHDRTIEITKFAHIKLPGKKRPALKVRGVVNAPGFESCHTDVPVKVQIRAGGEWVTRKTDTTNDNGVFKVLIRDVRGRYRAVATRFELSDPEANTLDVCRKAKDVRRHRH